MYSQYYLLRICHCKNNWTTKVINYFDLFIECTDTRNVLLRQSKLTFHSGFEQSNADIPSKVSFIKSGKWDACHTWFVPCFSRTGHICTMISIPISTGIHRKKSFKKLIQSFVLASSVKHIFPLVAVVLSAW